MVTPMSELRQGDGGASLLKISLLPYIVEDIKNKTDIRFKTEKNKKVNLLKILP